ncbi:MAG: SDR family NAD(P)-dependent oxidoreductase [Myxococcales bacterium]|nr:SDR family NAD(P)-dependent oxidoreductase [Myxococcales bacterium]
MPKPASVPPRDQHPVAPPLSEAPIAVVGVSALFPGSLGKEGFWRDILAGRDLVTDVPATHWLIDDYYDPDPQARDKTYAKRGAFLPDVDFDPVAWGVPPTIVPTTDTTQLLALIVAQQVLEDACGGQFARIDRKRTSVILGVTSSQELLGSMVSRLQKPVWVKALREMGLPESEVQEACDRIASHYVEWKESTFPGVLGNVVAGRIANRLDLGGTNCITDAACASSFSALAMAVAELRLGQSDLVITGGADTMNDIFMYLCFSKTPALSPTGDCRPFSDAADGTLLGEGIGMVALKRLADAERDGDRIYALVKGVGSSSDGRAKSVYAPVPEGQAVALRRAYDQAGYGPETVELMEAHGTGTKAGDAAEFEGLRQVFDESGRTDRNWCALGSVKSQVGHTKAAAGAAGLFKAVMALHHKILPPTIKVKRPDPKLKIEASPFYLNTLPRPWIRGEHPRRASVSSFGFGGSNFHVALEAYEGEGLTPARLWPEGGHLVLVGGATSADVANACTSLAREVEAFGDPTGEGLLAFLAHESQLRFDPHAQARLALVAQNHGDLRDKLEQAARLAQAEREGQTPTGVVFSVAPASPHVAFLFPGQGSQYLHMGAAVAMGFAPAQAAWDRVAHVARGAGALARVVFPPAAFDDAQTEQQKKTLTDTAWAQPAIGATSLAHLALLDTLGVRPTCVAGHSFGEVTALYAAGVFDEAAFLGIARQRGQLMAEQAQHTQGAMLSVAAPRDEVERQLGELGLAEVLVLANHNGPRQVVLSGPVEAIEAASRRLQGQGLSTTRLEVATAFHSPIVGGASQPFAAFLEAVPFSAPRVPVFANTTAAPYPHDAADMRRLLAEQLAKPVRFVDQIEAMALSGVSTFLEVGPGHVLTTLVSQILEGRPHRALALDRKGRPGVPAFLQGVGALAVAGVPMDFARLWAPFAVPTDPRLKPKPALTLKVNGAGYGKPYPPPGGTTALPKPNEPAPVSQPAPPAPLAAAPAPAPAVEASVQYAWLMAIAESQRQTAEAHAAFQRAMAESHTAFLRAAESTLLGLSHAMGAPGHSPLPLPAPAFAPPVPAFAPPPVPVYAAPMPAFAPSPTPAFPAPMPAFAPSPAPYAAPAPAWMPTAPSLAAPPAPVATPPFPPPAAPAPAPGVALAPAAPAATPDKRQGLERGRADPGGPAGVDVERGCLAHGLPRGHVGPRHGSRIRPWGRLDQAGRDPLRGDGAGAGSARSEHGPHGCHAHTARDRDVPRPGKRPWRPGGRPRGAQQRKASYERRRGGCRAPFRRSAEVAAPKVVLSRAEVQVSPAPALGFATPGLRSASLVVITQDAPGHSASVAHALAACLRAHGVQAKVIEGHDVPDDAEAVICLQGLRALALPEEGVPSAEALAHAAALNHDLFRVARAVAPRFSARGGTFVTVQDTGGDFGLSGSPRAWIASAAALARTAAVEWPACTVRAIDLAREGRSPEALAAALAHELLFGAPEPEVGLRANGERLRVTLNARAEAPGPTAAAIDGALDFVVATGGARGVTAACVLELARAGRGRFLLLGRTPLEAEPACCAGALTDAALKRALLDEARARGEAMSPAALGRRADAVRAGREVRATLEAIRALGSEVAYAAVDATQAEALAAVLADHRSRFGPVTGVIHGAGVLADKLIAEKTDEQYERVVSTKVKGLASVMAATAEDPLRFVFLFSSVAARSGNLGQSDYAMANEVLNKVAGRLRHERPTCVVRALGWGPWEGGMVDEGLKARFARLGVALVPVEGGARAFVDELRQGPRRCGDPDRRPGAAWRARAAQPGRPERPSLRGRAVAVPRHPPRARWPSHQGCARGARGLGARVVRACRRARASGAHARGPAPREGAPRGAPFRLRRGAGRTGAGAGPPLVRRRAQPHGAACPRTGLGRRGAALHRDL